MIALEGVTVRFGRTIALDRLDLRIDRGVTGLFGPNGSGKSTLLRVVAGLLQPSEGRTTLDGGRVSARDEVFRRRIGYSGHNPGLYERLTVRENLELFGSMYGCHGGRVDEVVETLALGDRAERFVGELSAGSKRTASVARALLHEPEVLLLDEPYANLDDESSEVLSAAVRLRPSGTITVIATHGAKRVRAFADAAVVLGRARLLRNRPEGLAPPVARGVS